MDSVKNIMLNINRPSKMTIRNRQIMINNLFKKTI